MRSIEVPLLMLLLGSVGAQAAQPPFYSRRDDYATNCIPGQYGLLTIADVNGDGLPDVVCNPVLLGSGNGIFRLG